MTVGNIVFLSFLYLISGPLILQLISLAHKKSVMKFNKVPPVETLTQIVKKHVAFTIKDVRQPHKSIPSQNRFVFILLYFSGLISLLAFSFIELYFYAFVVSVFFLFSAVGFSYSTAHSILKSRKEQIKKLIEVGGSIIPRDAGLKPESHVTVLEWRDLIYPHRVRFSLGTHWRESQDKTFLEHYNEQFGSTLQWVPDYDNAKGWDRENNVLHLRTVPPLPTIAHWDEKYITSPAVHWGFFPLGLSIANGVQLTNEDNPDETEYVVGLDIVGEQLKHGSKAGVKVAPYLVNTPQVLIAGGTGGGKAMSVDTLVQVLREDEEK